MARTLPGSVRGHGGISCSVRSGNEAPSTLHAYPATPPGPCSSPSHANTPRPAAGPGGKTGLQQITAGRRLPVQHFPGREHAGPAAQHPVRIHFVQRDPAGAGNRPRDRRRRQQAQRHRLDQGRQIGRGAGMQRLLHQPDPHRRQPARLAQEGRQRRTAARPGQPAGQRRQIRSGRRSSVATTGPSAAMASRRAGKAHRPRRPRCPPASPSPRRAPCARES